MDYKETLLLPQTAFPMRGNLPQNEPARYAKWFSKEESAYARMIKNRENSSKTFILHDGPPYAHDQESRKQFQDVYFARRTSVCERAYSYRTCTQ